MIFCAHLLTEAHIYLPRNFAFKLHMPSIDLSCWVYQSGGTSKAAKRRGCSPCPSHLPKPQSSKASKSQPSRQVKNKVVGTLKRRDKEHNSGLLAIEDATKPHKLRSSTCIAVPGVRIPTLAILSPEFPWPRPSITLTGPTNDFPTMDIDTFKEYGRGLEGSSNLRISSRRTGKRRRHCVRPGCKQCDEATLANARFTEGMNMHGAEGNERKGGKGTSVDARGTEIRERYQVVMKDQHHDGRRNPRHGGSKGVKNAEIWLKKAMADLRLRDKYREMKDGTIRTGHAKTAEKDR